MNMNSNNLSAEYLNKLKDSIFRISHAVHDINNIDSLFRFVHHEVETLVHSNNFYIALLNEERNAIRFPYYVDINDAVPEESMDLGTGLTSLILKSNKPLLINKKEYLDLVKNKKINEFGSTPESWLGVPLTLHDNRPIGIIAIQSYSKDIIFSEDDLEILNFVSEQIALAIEKVNAIKHIEQISKYDELTKLPNKKLFFDLALKEIIKNDNHLLFVLIDLDDFMLINDNYGHDVGNKIIQKISTRLKRFIHEDEHVSYWGGDKFNLILKPKQINSMDSIVIDIMKAIKQNITIEGVDFQINSSIGISTFPDDNKNLNQLIRNSEIAMNFVKNNGKNNYKFYKPSIRQNLMDQYGLEVGLRKAILDKQWEIFYQPKFDSSNSIYGFEALIRWIHPQKGMISPLDFIPIAEKSNQISKIGKYMIENVCTQTQTWIKDGHDLIASVNLSARQLENESVVKDIEKSLKKTGMSPKNLEIEITESVMMKNEKKSMEILNKIKDLGVFLSIDDFGTGYSSFNYLNTMPIDTIKIDKSFVSGIDKEKEKYKIANTIIGMGKDLNISVIAEGVETKDEYKALESANCNKYQGYYFSKPLTSSQFKNIL